MPEVEPTGHVTATSMRFRRTAAGRPCRFRAGHCSVVHVLHRPIMWQYTVVDCRLVHIVVKWRTLEQVCRAAAAAQ